MATIARSEMIRALTALYAQVPEEVARDVERHFADYEAELRGARQVTDVQAIAAWNEYDPKGIAGGWERVAFISGYGKGIRDATR